MKRLVLIIGLATILCYWYVGDKFLNKGGRRLRKFSLYISGKIGISREMIVSMMSLIHYTSALLLMIVLIFKVGLDMENIHLQCYFDLKNIGLIPVIFFGLNIVSMMIIFIGFTLFKEKDVFKSLQNVRFIKNFNRYNRPTKLVVLLTTSTLEFILFNIAIPYMMFTFNIGIDSIVYLTSALVYIIFKYITVKNIQSLLIMGGNSILINIICVFFINTSLNLLPITIVYYMNLFLYSSLQSGFSKRRG